MVYHYIGESEYGNGGLLMIVSALLSCVTLFVLGWGFAAAILAQLAIGAVLTLLKIFKKAPSEDM